MLWVALMWFQFFRQVYMTWSSKCCVVRINESQIFLKECKEKRCCLVVHCQKQMPKSSSTVWVSRISRCLQTSWKQHLGEISRRKSCSSFASSCWTICTVASVQLLLRGLAMRRHYNSTKNYIPFSFDFCFCKQTQSSKIERQCPLPRKAMVTGQCTNISSSAAPTPASERTNVPWSTY